MKLAIHALAVCRAPLQLQRSLLGASISSAYGHLYDPAGNRSRPATVRRGVTLLYSDPYHAPAVDTGQRSADLASAAVAGVLANVSHLATRVFTVLHTQCTLDQQILGSTCLRIEHDHFPGAATAATIGQLGTAGIPTTLHLAARDLLERASGSLASISACDKWIAPFFRRVPGLVTYGDAAGACLVGLDEVDPLDEESGPVAMIQAVSAGWRATEYDLWTAAASVQREAMLAHVASRISELLTRCHLQRDAVVLAGDGYGEEFEAALAHAVGLPVARLLPAGDIHLSSAAPLFALDRAIEAAVAGRESTAIVWTASPSGHAAAMLIRCSASAARTPDGWVSRSALASNAVSGAQSQPGASPHFPTSFAKDATFAALLPENPT